MNTLPPEIVTHIGRFLERKDCGSCRLAAKHFNTIGYSFACHSFPLNCNYDYVYSVKKCLYHIRKARINIDNTLSREVNVVPTIDMIRQVFPNILIEVFIVQCTRPDIIMSILPKNDQNILVYIEWILTNIGPYSNTALQPELMVGHRIERFTAKYAKNWSFLTHKPFVDNVRHLIIGDGGFRIDLSQVDLDKTSQVVYNVTYQGAPDIIDPHKITSINISWDDRPPFHVINAILNSHRPALKEISSDKFYHQSWTNVIDKLPCDIQYYGVVSSPHDIYMVDYFQHKGRTLSFVASNIEQYHSAIIINYITGYNIPIIKKSSSIQLSQEYMNIRNLWDSMSNATKSIWGILFHIESTSIRVIS